MSEHDCDGGWICEQHPDHAWPHGYRDGDPLDHGCAGPGMPCRAEPCEFWPDNAQRMPLMDGSPRWWVVSR